MAMTNNRDFHEVFSLLKTENGKKMAECLIPTVPDYFYHVPASSTGKYHPAQDLGDGGLYRHTIAVCKIIEHLSVTYKLDDHTHDLAIIAGMMHDSRKSGNQAEYEAEPHTKFNHPNLAAAVTINTLIMNGFIYDDADRIYWMIACHMGQWTTSKYAPEVELHEPHTFEELLVHTADYLASRKNITVDLEGGEE